MRVRISLIALFVLLMSAAAFSQEDKSKRPSPPAQADCKLPDGKTVHVDYSSPRMKGRKIVGDLVPYGQVWRAGANEATTLTTTTDLSAGGKDIPAGTYTLFAIPTEEKWTLIISKTTGEWGTKYSGPDQDLARVDMKVASRPSEMENFTISLKPSGAGCTMHMIWEKTEASIDFTEKK
jgi:hypothetical protein